MNWNGFGPQFVESNNSCRGLWSEENLGRPNKVEVGRNCSQSPDMKILSTRLAALPLDQVNLFPFKGRSISSQLLIQYSA
jgi:hypothetical protein